MDDVLESLVINWSERYSVKCFLLYWSTQILPFIGIPLHRQINPTFWGIETISLGPGTE